MYPALPAPAQRGDFEANIKYLEADAALPNVDIDVRIHRLLAYCGSGL